ncbi:MAG: hypothetical protein R3Y45_04385, partial [Bacillota bacterium]
KKNKSQYFWLVVSLISLIIFVALIFSSVMQTVNAEDGSSDTEAVTEIEVATETEAETKTTTEEIEEIIEVVETIETEEVLEVVESLSSAEELVLKIEQWQEWLDKYAMPSILAILSSVTAAAALFYQFKKLKSAYESYKAQADETSEANWATFKAENEEMFTELKTSISETLSTISESFASISSTTLETVSTLSDTTLTAVSSMPIESIKELLSANTDDTAVTASCVLKLETLLGGITELMEINEDVATVPADTKRAFKAKLDEIKKTLSESVMSDNWTKLKEKVLEDANQTKLYELIATVINKDQSTEETTEVET